MSEQNKIVVTADRDLEDIIPGYLANRQKDIADMSAALDGGDFETIRVLGHRMKGSGGGYGFDQITEIGASLEQAAKGGDGDTIRARVAELVDYLARVEVTYED